MPNNEAKRLIDLPVKTALANTSDQLVFAYGAGGGSNATNSALISVENLLKSNVNIRANTIILNDKRADPANSTALTITQGTIFYSNTALYIAVTNNHVLKVADLTSF